MPLHLIPNLVPKSIGYSLVYSPITQNGEFVVFRGQINEHSVAFSRSVHAQMGKDLLGSFVGILSRRPFQMHPDFSRCVLLGLPNGRKDPFFALRIEKRFLGLSTRTGPQELPPSLAWTRSRIVPEALRIQR